MQMIIILMVLEYCSKSTFTLGLNLTPEGEEEEEEESEESDDDLDDEGLSPPASPPPDDTKCKKNKLTLYLLFHLDEKKKEFED